MRGHFGSAIAALIAVAVLVSGCGGGGDSGPQVSPPVPPPANTAPIASLASPADLSVCVVGDVIEFSGIAGDDEDGALSGASLAWSSIE